MAQAKRQPSRFSEPMVRANAQETVMVQLETIAQRLDALQAEVSQLRAWLMTGKPGGSPMEPQVLPDAQQALLDAMSGDIIGRRFGRPGTSE